MRKMTDCKKMIDGKCFAECKNEGTDECCHRCSFYDPDFDLRKCVKEIFTYYSERRANNHCKQFYRRFRKLLGSEANRILGTGGWDDYYKENINSSYRRRDMNFWTPERIQTMLELKSKGFTVHEIADTIGHTYTATQQRLWKERHR